MKEEIKEQIREKADENLNYLKKLLQGNSDIVFREYFIQNKKAVLVYIDGMADKLLLDKYVIEPMMQCLKEIKNARELKDRIIEVSDIKEVDKMAQGVQSMLSGDTLMFVDGLKVAYVIATRSWPARGVSEPSGETVIRGAREGFVETIRFNTALIRRRVRDTRLKIEAKTVGVRSKTDMAIIYIEDIVNKEALKELQTRMKDINIDAVLDSAYISEYIEDNKYSPFPQIQSTERPDVVAAAIYEGRIAILVDNSPFAIIIPATMANMFQSPDDYYQRWMEGSVLRMLRFISIFITLLLPALYIAVTSFQTSIIPTKLAYSIAASREGVPFPAFMEVIIMEISLSLLIEAIARLPKPIGATIGIVGGLIIGQAAVGAGIVSPIMIIIVGLTAITTFITPNYEITSAFRFIRFFLIILSSIFGLYGIMLGLILVLIHLIKLKSFSIPYLAPLVSPNFKDFKDLFLRLPIKFLKERPEYMHTKDKIRQK
ncbi:spore germination protein [Clostridiaceae bacterium 14S0207]|nr:spore germination protein [Clostridiaceae bacterium 14S0207]